MFKLLSRLLVATCVLGSAWAQGVPTAVVNTPQLRAELTAHAPQGVQADQEVWVGLQLTHQPEWHTYWRNPGDSGLPTQIELNLPAGITAGDVQWPLPHKLKAGNLTNYGYDKIVLLAVPLTVSKQYKPNASQTLDLQVHANWLVCRLECIPQEGDFALRIPVNSSYAPQAAAFDALKAQQPQVLPNVKATTSFDAQRLALQVRGLPAALHGQASQSWQEGVWTVQLALSNLRLNDPKDLSFVITSGAGSARQGFEVSAAITQAWPGVSELPAITAPAIAPTASDESALGFILALLGAFVGGLILNLMPCVLPVLAIKLLGFAQHSRAHRAHRVAGMAYTAGVVLSFLALGAGVLALRAAGTKLASK
jgi:thiol:disulfide interchange protein DsbD